MYTFYFQHFEKWDLHNYKLIAFKGSEIPDGYELGLSYLGMTLGYLVDAGYQVVVRPEEAIQGDSSVRMFYAKGYRGLCENPVSDTVSDPEYLKFVNYANGASMPLLAPDWCNEDFGQERASVPEQSANSGESAESAQNAKNGSGDTPQIGPLPPQASLAPIGDNPLLVPSGFVYGTWHAKVEVPRQPTWEETQHYQKLREIRNGPLTEIPAEEYLQWKESQALEAANAKTSKPPTASDEPSWWQMLKNWVKSDF